MGTGVIAEDLDVDVRPLRHGYIDAAVAEIPVTYPTEAPWSPTGMDAVVNG